MVFILGYTLASRFGCISVVCFFFFFQAEDGIRDAQESRGLGDVYKRQVLRGGFAACRALASYRAIADPDQQQAHDGQHGIGLSLIHI